MKRSQQFLYLMVTWLFEKHTFVAFLALTDLIEKQRQECDLKGETDPLYRKAALQYSECHKAMQEVERRVIGTTCELALYEERKAARRARTQKPAVWFRQQMFRFRAFLGSSIKQGTEKAWAFGDKLSRG